MNTGNSWKTTSAGIVMIAGGVVGMIFAWRNNALNEASVMAGITAIVGGIGFLKAKDAGVTGGTIVAKNNDPDVVQASAKQ